MQSTFSALFDTQSQFLQISNWHDKKRFHWQRTDRRMSSTAQPQHHDALTYSHNENGSENHTILLQLISTHAVINLTQWLKMISPFYFTAFSTYFIEKRNYNHLNCTDICDIFQKTCLQAVVSRMCDESSDISNIMAFFFFTSQNNVNIVNKNCDWSQYNYNYSLFAGSKLLYVRSSTHPQPSPLSALSCFDVPCVSGWDVKNR